MRAKHNILEEDIVFYIQPGSELKEIQTNLKVVEKAL